jgi:hypothetical protein
MTGYLDLKEASVYLKCHPATLNRLAVTNKVPAYKKLNKWYFKEEDLANMLRPNALAAGK